MFLKLDRYIVKRVSVVLRVEVLFVFDPSHCNRCFCSVFTRV